MFECWCSFYRQEVWPTVEVFVSYLVGYLDFLQVNHNYYYRMLSMHASALCYRLQPTEQTFASSGPIVWQLLKVKAYSGGPLQAESLDVKKTIDLLHSWRKLAVLNYTRLTSKTVMILALAIVKWLSDLNLLKITPRAMQVIADSVTFRWSVWPNNAQANHPYWPAITLRQSEGEYLCLVALV